MTASGGEPSTRRPPGAGTGGRRSRGAARDVSPQPRTVLPLPPLGHDAIADGAGRARRDHTRAEAGRAWIGRSIELRPRSRAPSSRNCPDLLGTGSDRAVNECEGGGGCVARGHRHRARRRDRNGPGPRDAWLGRGRAEATHRRRRRVHDLRGRPRRRCSSRPVARVARPPRGPPWPPVRRHPLEARGRHVSAEPAGTSPEECVPGELHGEGEHRGEEHGADEPRPVPDREP